MVALRCLPLLLLPLMANNCAKPVVAGRTILAMTSDSSVVDWARFQHQQAASFTLRFLRDTVFQGSCSLQALKSTKDTLQTLKTHFHWIDLNQDGADDLVYMGNCLPYLATEIYLNENGRPKQVYKAPGIVSDMAVSDHNTCVFIRTDACCCESFNRVDSLVFVQKSFDRPAKRSIVWHWQIPLEGLRSGRAFQTPNQVNLRYTPMLNDTIAAWECDDDIQVKGNVVASFRANTAALIVDKIQKGHTNWYLVLIQPNNHFVATDFEHQPFEAGITYALGWVSAAELGLP